MIQFKKTLPEAVIPRRAGPQEAGFDVTLVRYEKQMAPNAYMFDTGIALSPPPGYYALLVARSSLVKYNVLLTNSMGVIDPTYTGSLKVVLSFLGEETLDTFVPRLPLKLCQLLFLPFLAHLVEVEVSELSEMSPEAAAATAATTAATTARRGANGFGSTDNNNNNLSYDTKNSQ